MIYSQMNREDFIKQDSNQKSPKKQDILELQNKYSDRNCFIIARGTSVRAFNFSAIKESDIIIAINSAITLSSEIKIDYCLYSDQAFIDYLEHYNNKSGVKIIGHKSNLWDHADYYFETKGHYCQTGVSTAYYALQIALNVFDCKAVYLVGIDGYTDNKGIVHFDDMERKPYLSRQFENMINDFQTTDWGDNINKIYNCNLKSKVKKFNFADFDKKVLILGNGISRLEPKIKKFIDEFDGEIWICNGAFQEALKLKNITRVTGHVKVLVEADLFRERNNNLKYKIYTNNPSVADICSTKQFLCDKKWLRDSGTSWVCEALTEGYNQIYCAGFDMGGKDIYAKEHEKVDIGEVWKNRWRQIKNDFGLDRIIFLGKNHKEDGTI